MKKIRMINENGKIKKGFKIKLSIVLPEYTNLLIIKCWSGYSSKWKIVNYLINNELAYNKKEKVYEPEKVIVISEEPFKSIILRKDEKKDKILQHKIIIEAEHEKRGSKRRKKSYTIIKITDEVDIFAGIFSIFVVIWLKILHELFKRKRRSYLDNRIRKEANTRGHPPIPPIEENREREKEIFDQLQRLSEILGKNERPVEPT